MSETIEVIGEPTYDRYNRLVPGRVEKTIAGCVVGLRSQSEISGEAVFDGDATTLQVLAPAGTQVSEGMTVRFRGALYDIVHVPFDWSPGRRPVLATHQPRTVFLISRKEA